MNEWEVQQLRDVAAELRRVASAVRGTRLPGGDVRADVPRLRTAEERVTEYARDLRGQSLDLRGPTGQDTQGSPRGVGPEKSPTHDAAKANAPHSDHYKGTSVEPIDLIEAWGLPFHLANVVKYVCRSQGPVTNDYATKSLEKAQWYLNRFISERKRLRV